MKAATDGMATSSIADHRDFITFFAGRLHADDLPFWEFANEVMQEYMAEEPDDFVALTEMHKEWQDVLQDSSRTAIICARGHLKTSFSLVYLLWNMIMQENFRALYLGNTFSQVVDKLTQFEELARRSWRCAPFIAKKGNFAGMRRWNLSQKQFMNGSRVRGAVVGGALEGPHCHLIILDDILEEFPRLNDVRTITYLNRVVLPMRLPNAQILLIGTQKRVGDVTEYVCENPKWDSIRHPALLEDGTPRWPEYWTIDRLEDEKLAMGSRAFESEYMLNPIDPESAVIPWSVLEPCLDRAADMVVKPITGENWHTFIGVDLAVGMDKQNDETAYVALAYNTETLQRQVLHCWNGRVRGEGAGWLKAQVDNITKVADMFKPTSVMIESNGFQRLVAHAARDVERLPVRSHNTGNERNHAQIGVPGLAVQLEKGLYTIPFSPTAEEASRPGTRDLVRGLSHLMWGLNGRIEGHIADPVIALWMCELAIHDYEKNHLSMATWEWL